MYLSGVYVPCTTIPDDSRLRMYLSGVYVPCTPIPDDSLLSMYLSGAPQWGAADAEIKVPSGENTELKLAVANTDSCVGPQNKIGHPA